jgi:RecJ-like exonuclease
MTNNVLGLNKQAADIILSFPRFTRIRVVSHYDADGISAAAILCKALYRQGYDFHASLMRNPFIQGLERVKKEHNKLVVFCDMGSGQIELVEQFDGKIIIIDHHQYLKSETSDHVLQINANLCGMNGNYEACGASLSYGVAKTLDPKNVDLIPLALSGVTGDKQYIGGIRGYNKTVLEEGVHQGLLKPFVGVKLYGESLFDALYHSVDPYYSDLSVNEKEIKSLLKQLHIYKDTSIGDLED